jgi:hypothetical protein
MKTDTVQTIRGYVQPLPETPDREDAPKVAVITEDGTPYHIVHKGAGVDLAGCISMDVEVRGTVAPLPPENEDAPDAEGEAGNPRAFLLTARSYQFTDSFDDLWYDDA